MNENTQAYIGSVIRALLTLSPFITTKLGGDGITTTASIIAAIIALVWSLWQKKSTNTNAHAKLENAVNAAAATPENASSIIAAAKAGKF
jgi:hypothetical protein